MIETSSPSSSLYPSFDHRYDVVSTTANANAPPMTDVESERWPLTASAPMHDSQQPPSYTDYYIPPSYRQVPSNHSHPSDRHHHLGVHWQYNNKPGFVITTLKLTLFHLLNALLGIVAFTAVITSVHIAFALIPLCCVGLLVFRGVVVLVQWLAKLDVKLANYVASPDEERVSLGVHDDEVGGFVDLRLSPELSYFSPVSVLGALYFATVKLVISVLSLVVVSVFALLPAMLFAFNDDDEHMHMWFKVGHHKYKDLCKDPFAFYIVWGCLFILCIVCMHVIAWISRFTTLFFCSERITASEYTIPVVEYPATATTATVYGSNIPTRL